jgi:hypothetical protein
MFCRDILKEYLLIDTTLNPLKSRWTAPLRKRHSFQFNAVDFLELHGENTPKPIVKFTLWKEATAAMTALVYFYT